MKSFPRIIITSAVSFITVMAMLFILARPLLSDISLLHTKEAEQKTGLNQLGAQLTAYNQAKAQLKEVDYKDSLDNAIVIREDLAAVLVEIEAYAAQTDVTESILIIDDQPTSANAKEKPVAPKSLIPNEKNISEVGYTISFQGKFADVLKFMQYLEHLSHFTEVSSLAFSAVLVPTSSLTDVIHADTINGTISGVFFIKKK